MLSKLASKIPLVKESRFVAPARAADFEDRWRPNNGLYGSYCGPEVGLREVIDSMTMSAPTPE